MLTLSVSAQDYICHVCGMHLSAQQALDNHMLRHGDLKPHKCTYPGCDYSCRSTTGLSESFITHLRLHIRILELTLQIKQHTFEASTPRTDDLNVTSVARHSVTLQTSASTNAATQTAAHTSVQSVVVASIVVMAYVDTPRLSMT